MKIALLGEIHCIGLGRIYIRLCTQTNMSLDMMQNCAVRKDISSCTNCTPPFKYYYGYKKRRMG
jgi:hypothetical protein